MSRQKKTGLDYFPLVTGFFKDRRIRRLISRFGADGALFYIYILCTAYENGYYIQYDDDFADDAALDIGCTVEKIGLMLNYLLDKSLLDGTLFRTVKVITSHGIQTQYQESMKNLRRDIEVDPNIWILEPSRTQEFIKVRRDAPKNGIYEDKSGKMSDTSWEMDPNKRKENKTIRNEKKEEETAQARALQASPPAEKGAFGKYVRLSMREYAGLLEELGTTEFSRCRMAVDTEENAGAEDWAALIRREAGR